MPRARILAVGLVATALALFAASPARAGSWQNQFSGFNAALKGDLYTPTTPAASPAVLVAIHMCTGTSNVVHGWFDSYAEQQGFYIIAPDAGKQCFDSSASRNGDKAAIVTMVNYLINNKNADKNRIFAAGMSSGGCMTNTLLAIYPDVFAGGSAMPGFPAGGWPSGDITCTKCGSNPPSTDGKYWGDMARAVFSWSGKYPCSQQWVGGGDEYKFNAWLPAVAAQFQNLSNLGAGMPATGRSGWTRTVYKDSGGNIRLETNLGPTSQMHDLETVNPKLYGDVITFLGLDKATGACGLDSGGTGGAGGGAGGTGGATGAGGRGGSGGTAGGAGGSNGGRGGNGSGSGGSGGSGGLTGAGGRGGMSAGSGGTTAGSGGSGPGGSTPGTGGTTSGSGGATQGAGGTTAGSGGSGTTGSAGSGTTGTGGSTTGTGGSVEPAGSGGTSGTGTGGTSPSGSGGTGPGDNGASGCACAVTGGSQGGVLAMFLVAALGLVVRRRSRRR